MNVAPFGSWPSSITASLIARQTVGLGQLAYDGDDLYWTETRPTESGRSVLMRKSRQARPVEALPPEFSVRSRVHEYGGGSFVVFDEVIVFSNDTDQRLYRKDPGASPRPLTPLGAIRYADSVVDRTRRAIVAVREDKRLFESREDVNTLVAISLDGDGQDAGRVLVAGADFYSSPRLSADGSRIAWLSWSRPDMPWDAAELWEAGLDAEGAIVEPRRVAGGGGESVFQPEWSPSGELYFVSDRSGYWNLYRWSDGKVQPVLQRRAEFGVPQWTFGMSSYAFASAREIVLIYVERGIAHLGRLDLRTGIFSPMDVPYTSMSGIRGRTVLAMADVERASALCEPGRVAFAAGSPTEPAAFVELDLASNEREAVCRATEFAPDPSWLSLPEVLQIPLGEGDDEARHGVVHAFYYPPHHPGFVAPADEKPPLLVRCHGGPTAASSTALSLGIQFWTSRGFAVVDVNYGGSTGYGRAYRERLRGQWGVVDVDDCVRAARYLVDRGRADPKRLAISGGSAGGFTVLCALTFRQVFAAGASHYGISDLEVMARDARTGNPHKFESRYDEGLVAPYPEGLDVYRARSPLQHADRLSTPVIFFQGMEDRVVLPNQAERMVEVLRRKGLPVAYLAFAGEGHGFRRAENIERVLEAELYFYSRIFGFLPADTLAAVPIDNFEARCESVSTDPPAVPPLEPNRR